MAYKLRKFNFYFAGRLIAANIFLRRYWLFLPIALFSAMVFFQDYRLIFFLILGLFLLVGINSLIYFTLVFICILLAFFVFFIGDFIILQYIANFLLTLFAGFIMSNVLFPAENKKALYFLNQERFGKKDSDLNKSKGYFSSIFYRVLLFFTITFFLFFGLNSASSFVESIKRIFDFAIF